MKQPQKIKIDQLEDLFGLSSTYVDRAYLTVENGMMRFTFVESMAEVDKVKPRVSVTMRLEAAMGVYTSLSQIAEILKKQQEESQPKDVTH